MEKGDKGSTMIRMGVSGWMFLLVPAYPGCPGSKAVRRSLLILICFKCYNSLALQSLSCIHKMCTVQFACILGIGLNLMWFSQTCGLNSMSHAIYLIICLLVIYYTKGLTFCFCYLFLYFLLALRSQNQQMDGTRVCYKQLRVWCNFNILLLDSSPRSFIFREVGKLPQIVPKIWRCPHLARCRNQTVQRMKTRKYSFKRGIVTLHFDEKYANLPVLIFEEPWQMCWEWIPSRLLLAMAYHAIAAI